RIKKIKKKMNLKQFVWVVPYDRYMSRHIPYILSIIYFPQDLLHQESNVTFQCGDKWFIMYKGEYQAFVLDIRKWTDNMYAAQNDDGQVMEIFNDVVKLVEEEKISDF